MRFMVVALKSVLLASCEFEENEVSCNHAETSLDVPDWTVALVGLSAPRFQTGPTWRLVKKLSSLVPYNISTGNMTCTLHAPPIWTSRNST